MTRVIETRKNNFKFYLDDSKYVNEFSTYVEVIITIIEKEYVDFKRFYYVNYDYKLISEEEISEAKKFRIISEIIPMFEDDNSSG